MRRTAAAILREVGYGEEIVAKVEKLLRKRQLKQDPDVQLLEDAICLVFLENDFAGFSAQHEEAKVIDIVRKTWAKMSVRGQTATLALELPPAADAPGQPRTGSAGASMSRHLRSGHGSIGRGRPDRLDGHLPFTASTTSMA